MNEFQSLDWVDVDFDGRLIAFPLFVYLFQSLDWVDVDFDMAAGPLEIDEQCFNPSTGLMLISTLVALLASTASGQRFQSLDWVDVDFDNSLSLYFLARTIFQSLDWVDVDFDD